MAKRIKFKCWNCERVYSLLREIKDELRLIEECPFCGSECVVNLAPWRSEATTIFKGSANDEAALGDALDLPDVLPTQKPDQ